MAKALKTVCGTPDSPLRIGDVEIDCYVLENETRVISQRGMLKAIGLAAGGGSVRGEHRLVQFVTSKTFSKLISSDIQARTKTPLLFKGTFNTTTFGYEATLLQEIIRAISKAYLRGELPNRYEDIGARAEMLDDAFAKIGIIALVDEATGYQQLRDKNALRKILAAYINPHLLPWAERFPKEFYEEIFRLRGWAYNPATVKRPGVIGTWTNKLVYEQLPDGVLEELKKRTPKTSTGLYAAQFHRSLTSDTGHPHLDKQITAVVTLMKISPSWNKFLALFAKVFNKGQQELDLGDGDE